MRECVRVCVCVCVPAHGAAGGRVDPHDRDPARVVERLRVREINIIKLHNYYYYYYYYYYFDDRDSALVVGRLHVCDREKYCYVI